jgi:cellulose synthase/poly-beta-1,6-N-acetylglucosamine synthase-like glycosyltransferase
VKYKKNPNIICLFKYFHLHLQHKNNKMDLTIIVPVYNVEDYIRPCIESFFQQGRDKECFEVIIVNDGTKDRSMAPSQCYVWRTLYRNFIHPHANCRLRRPFSRI